MDPETEAQEHAENRERLQRLRSLQDAPLRHIDEITRVYAELEPFVSNGSFREDGAEEAVSWARDFLNSAPRR